jgi:hypothetical protein
MSILSIESRSESRKGSRVPVFMLLAAQVPALVASNRPPVIRPLVAAPQTDGRAVDYRATVHITFRIS